MPTPELRIGPQNPDEAADLIGPAGIGSGSNALELINRNADLYPPEVMAAQAAPRDPVASDALDLDEVAEVVSDVEGAEVTAAAVRGTDGKNPQVVVLYIVESGRSAKAVVPLSELPKSEAAIETAREEAEAREQGAPAVNDQELSDLRRQIGELRDALDADRKATDDEEKQQLRERVAELEETQEETRERAEDAEERLRSPGSAPTPTAPSPNAEPEPWAGYDDLNVAEVLEQLKNVDDDTRRAIARYERENKSRDTIIARADKD
jgi:hypothetical protein